jgi:hypothetical protein
MSGSSAAIFADLPLTLSEIVFATAPSPMTFQPE